MPTTDRHELNVPREDARNWNEPLNENFRDLDALVMQTGSLSNRPSANGSNPPYAVTSPDTDRGLYVDTGSWVLVAAP